MGVSLLRVAGLREQGQRGHVEAAGGHVDWKTACGVRAHSRALRLAATAGRGALPQGPHADLKPGRGAHLQACSGASASGNIWGDEEYLMVLYGRQNEGLYCRAIPD